MMYSLGLDQLGPADHLAGRSGLVVYFTYGRHHSRVQKLVPEKQKSPATDYSFASNADALPCPEGRRLCDLSSGSLLPCAFVFARIGAGLVASSSCTLCTSRLFLRSSCGDELSCGRHMKITTAAEMRAIDRATTERFGCLP